ncbi:MAG: hypothetical protein WCG04_01615 [Alphaproteobacteria bacterium]
MKNKGFGDILFAVDITGLPRFARNDLWVKPKGRLHNARPAVIARPRSGRGNPGDLNKV